MGVVGDPCVCTRAPLPTSDAVALLRSQIHQVHVLLDEQAITTWERAPTAPAAQRDALSMYVHALCVEDITINVLLRKAPPMYTDIWLGGQLQPWDLTSARCYAQVVYAATDVLFTRLTPEDLRREIDLSSMGLGRPDATWVLNRFILWPMAMTCGELSAIARAEASRMNGEARALPTHAAAMRAGHEKSRGTFAAALS
jgi:hypothetical protein